MPVIICLSSLKFGNAQKSGGWKFESRGGARERRPSRNALLVPAPHLCYCPARETKWRFPIRSADSSCKTQLKEWKRDPKMRNPMHVLLLMVAIAVGGCGEKEPTPGPAPPKGKREVREARGTLTFWHIMNYEGPREVIEAAVRRFEAANPDVKVNLQTFDNDPYKTKLNIEMASGTPPDVFFTWGGGGLASFAEAGRALDLTDALRKDGWQDRFLPQPLSFCTCGGRVYAAPLDLSCVPVWYNAELFAKQQLATPKTFDELLDLCKKLRAKGITPMALGNMQQWPGAFYFIYLAARIGGAELFIDAAARKPGKSFNDPSFIRAGELLQKLIEARAFSTGFNGIEDGHARTQFLNGDAAMYLMGTWVVARAKEEKPDFLPKMKCFPFPSVDSGKGDPAIMVGGVNCAFAVSATCKRPEKAIELLRLLTAEEVGQSWCKIGRIPALRVREDAVAQLPAPTRAARGLLEAAKTIQPYYDQYLPPRLAEEHKKTTQGLFARTLTPAEAAERMEKCARELERQPPK